MNFTFPIIINGDLILRPLFCNEVSSIAYPGDLTQRCYSQNEKAVLYLKSEEIKMIINGNLTIQNVAFDGVDDISKYNHPSLDLSYCLSNSIRCCQENNLMSSIKSQLFCQKKNMIFENLYMTNAIFLIRANSEDSFVKILNSDIKYMNFLNTSSFFQIENLKKIEFTDTIVTSSFLDSGLIYLNSSLKISEVKISNITLNKYNSHEFLSNSTEEKGILITDPFNSILSLVITDSDFANMNIPVLKQLIKTTANEFILKNSLFQNISILGVSEARRAQFFKNYNSTTTFTNLTFNRLYMLHGELFNNDIKNPLELSSLKIRLSEINLDSVLIIAINARVSLLEISNSNFNDYSSQAKIIQQNSFYSLPGIVLSDLNISSNRFINTETILHLQSQVSVSGIIFSFNTFTPQDKANVIILSLDTDDVFQFITFYNNTFMNSYSDNINLMNVIFCDHCLMKNIDLRGNVFQGNFIALDLQLAESPTLNDINIELNEYYNENFKSVMLLLAGTSQFSNINIASNYLPSTVAMMMAQRESVISVNNITVYNNKLVDPFFEEFQNKSMFRLYPLTTLNLTDVKIMNNYLSGYVSLFYSGMSSTINMYNSIISENFIISNVQIFIYVTMFAFDEESNFTVSYANYSRNTHISTFTIFTGMKSVIIFENFNMIDNLFQSSNFTSGFSFTDWFLVKFILKDALIERNHFYSAGSLEFNFLSLELDVEYLLFSNITLNQNHFKGTTYFSNHDFAGEITDFHMAKNTIDGNFQFFDLQGSFSDIYLTNFLIEKNNLTCEICIFFEFKFLKLYFRNFTFTQNNIDVLGSSSRIIESGSYSVANLEVTFSNNSIQGDIILINLIGLMTEGQINMVKNSIINPRGANVFIFAYDMIFQDFQLYAYNNTIISENFEAGIIRFSRWPFFLGIKIVNMSYNYIEGENSIMAILSDYYGIEWEFTAHDNVFVNSRMLYANAYELMNVHIFNNTIISKNGRMRSFIDAILDIEIHNSIIENNTLYGDSLMINHVELCNMHDTIVRNNKFFDRSTLVRNRIRLKNILFENNELYDDAIFLQGQSSYSMSMEYITFRNFTFYGKSILITCFDNVFTLVESNFTNMHINSDRSKFLVTLSKTNFQITNFSMINSSSFLEITDSSGMLGDINIQNIRGLSTGIRIAIDLTSSAVNISNMKIKGDPTLVAQRYNLLVLREGDIIIENLEFHDMISDIGSQIQLLSRSKVSISNFVCYNVYAKDGTPLISSKTSLSLSLESLDFLKTNSILTSLLTSSINANDVLFDSVLTSPLFDIQDSEYVTLKYIDLSASNFATIIESVISIKEPQIKVHLDHLVITDFETSNGAIFISSSLFSIDVYFKHTRLGNNTLYGSGSALAIELAKNSSIIFDQCEFHSNKAYKYDQMGGKGGAIYLYSTFNDPYIRSSVNIIDSKFSKNFAELNGGAIFFNGIIPQVDSDTEFKENKIRTNISNNIATQAVRVMIVDEKEDTKTNQISLENLPSGITYDRKILLELLDYYNQTSYDDSISIVNLVENITSNLRLSRTTFQADFGRYIIQDLIFTDNPNVSSYFQLKSNGIQQFSSFNITEENSLAKFEVSFRNCLQGETLLDSGECYFCPDGYASFSFELNTKVPCTQCDNRKMICPGGSVVQELPGYWKLNSTSDIIYPCDFQSACLGNLDLLSTNLSNPDNINSTCAKSYTGNLCSSCALGYGKNFRGSKCSECSDLAGFVLITIFVLIWNVFYIVLSVHYQHKQNTMEDEDPDAQIKNRRLGTLFKNLTDYVQMISLFGTIPTNLPDSYREGALVTNQVIVINSNSFNSECFFQESVPGEDRIFIKTLIANLTPFVLLALLTIFWLVVAFIKRKDSQFKLKTNLAVTVIILIYTQQIQIIQANLEMYNCQRFYRNDNPISFLRTNPDTQCWTEKHYYWIIIMTLPILIIWAFFIPIKFLYLLWTHRENLGDKKIRTYYAYTYRGYKREKFFWEFIIMLRKYIIILLAVFGKIYSTRFQIYLILYVIGIAYILQQRFQPYLQDDHNWLEKISLISAGFVILSSSYFTFITRSSLLIDYFFVILINVSFFGYLSLYIGLFVPTLKEKILQSKVYIEVTKYFKKLLNKCRKKRVPEEDLERVSYINNGEISIKMKESELISLKVLNQIHLLEEKEDEPDRPELVQEIPQEYELVQSVLDLQMIRSIDLNSDRIEISKSKNYGELESIELDKLNGAKVEPFYEEPSDQQHKKPEKDPKEKSNDEIKQGSQKGPKDEPKEEPKNEQKDAAREDLHTEQLDETKELIAKPEENIVENDVQRKKSSEIKESVIKNHIRAQLHAEQNNVFDQANSPKEKKKERKIISDIEVEQLDEPEIRLDAQDEDDDSFSLIEFDDILGSLKFKNSKVADSQLKIQSLSEVLKSKNNSMIGKPNE